MRQNKHLTRNLPMKVTKLPTQASETSIITTKQSGQSSLSAREKTKMRHQDNNSLKPHALRQEQGLNHHDGLPSSDWDKKRKWQTAGTQDIFCHIDVPGCQDASNPIWT